jgi:alpha-ketoglutarate-dependent taurine dioxygenase
VNTMDIRPTQQTLGARIYGVDLAQPLSDAQTQTIIQTLGHYGVVSFADQKLSAQHLRDFSARFGELEINIANAYQEPGMPEVLILSNMVEDGKPLGIADAGQDWHTDMSYSRMIAFANVLYGISNAGDRRRCALVSPRPAFGSWCSHLPDPFRPAPPSPASRPSSPEARPDGITVAVAVHPPPSLTPLRKLTS